MHAVEKAVAQALKRIGVGRGELILIALSGGPDSVALARALGALGPRLGLRLCAAHFNHRLRAEESERDESFARALCEQLAVPLAVEAATELRAGAPNLEERARALRLSFLRRAAAARGAARIALAHNRDDQAETVLMRLLRGTGASGLKGMAEAGPGLLIRPLLRASRRDILDYLATLGCAWMTDSSNRCLTHLRNRVRHELIPLLERRYAAGLSRRLSALGVEMERLDQLLSALARSELERRALCPGESHTGALAAHETGQGGFGSFSVVGFERLPAALAGALVREFLAQSLGSLRRLGRAHIDAIVRLCASGPPNGRVSLPGRLRARRVYEKVVLEREIRNVGAPQGFDVELNVPGITEVVPAEVGFEAELIPLERAASTADLNEAWFDVAETRGALRVRNFRTGDRVARAPSGVGRKLKQLFQEHRVPRPRRTLFPVVTLDGAIVWVPGIARADGAPVAAKAEMALRVRVFSLIARERTPVLAFSKDRAK